MFVLVCLIGEILALGTQDYFFIHNSCTDQGAVLSFRKGSVNFEQTRGEKDLFCLLGDFEEGNVLFVYYFHRSVGVFGKGPALDEKFRFCWFLDDLREIVVGHLKRVALEDPGKALPDHYFCLLDSLHCLLAALKSSSL